jgi:hypothetical protein
MERAHNPGKKGFAHVRRAGVGKRPQLPGEKIPLHGWSDVREVVISRAVALPLPKKRSSIIRPFTHRSLNHVPNSLMPSRSPKATLVL